MPRKANLPWSAALRKRFGFETPDAFRVLEARGLFRWSEDYRYTDLSQPGDRYLWFNDMEWYPPDKLRGFEFPSYCNDGFIPFAFTAGGSDWCWYPAMESNDLIPVLLCHHDCYDADLYAPDFAAALYRHAVEYAAQPLLPEEDRARRRAMLKRFAVELEPIWPDAWRSETERIADVPIDWSEYEPMIAATFGKPYTGHFQVRWMNEL